MTDLIRRADAMGAVQDHFNADGFKGYDDGQKMMDRIKALPSAEVVSREVYEKRTQADEQIIDSYRREFAEAASAEAKATVIRSRTLMPTKDFKEWAERIREVNPNAVVIPCDAEVVSAEAEEHRIYKDGYNTGKAHASAEAVQEWISCSERLPSESGTYLTTTAKGSVCTDHYYANSNDICGRHWSYHRRREPIAWMPLPEPYKGGDDE